MQLVVNVCQMSLHRPMADGQRLTDFPIGLALRRKSQHPQLALRQRLDKKRLLVLWRRRHSGDLMHYLRGHLRTEGDIPAVDLPHRVDDFLHARSLQHIPIRAGFEKRQNLRDRVISGQNQNAHARIVALDPLRGLDAGHLRHVQIQQHHIRRHLRQLPQQFQPIADLSQHFDVARRLQKSANALTHEDMIICNHHGDLCHRCPAF